MEIKTNNEHLQADLKKIKKGARKLLLGTTLALSLYSGAKVDAADLNNQTVISEDASITDVSLDTVVPIPSTFLYDVKSASSAQSDTITVRDLQNIKYLTLTLYDNSPLDWLNYCTNLDEIICINHSDDLSSFQTIRNLPSLRAFSITNMYENKDVTFKKEDFAFLENTSSLQNLSLINIGIEPNFIENLTSLRSLNINCSDLNDKIDYSKLTFLDKLSFGLMGPYNIAVNFTNSDYNNLINNNVQIEAKEGVMDQVLAINNQLNEIINSLNISENASDQEKLDAILVYVLNNLDYDENVSNAILMNMETDNLSKPFYEGGYLYGALEKDSAICGNYSALVSALAKRLNLNTAFLTSDTHAWNLVTVEGNYYYVDATWLDSQKVSVQQNHYRYDEQGNVTGYDITFESVPSSEMINSGETDQLTWYLENPSEVPSIDKNNAHNANNLPSYIEITPLEETPPEELATMLQEEQIANEQEIDQVENIQPETDLETIQTEEVQETELQTEEETEEETEEIVLDVTNKKFKIKINNKVFIVTGGVLVGLATALGTAVAINKKKKRKKKKKRPTPYNNNYYSSYR